MEGGRLIEVLLYLLINFFQGRLVQLETFGLVLMNVANQSPN